MNPHRPMLRWHGGKWILGPWIVAQLPPHEVYVEPFAGGASVFLRKPRSRTEVLNDLDGDLVNLFRVLRDDALAARLGRLLELTPYSRAEWRMSLRRARNPVERARRLLVRSYLSFGTTSRRAASTGFRASVASRRGSTACADWARYPEAIPAFTHRLRGVVLEERPALEVIAQQDGPGVLFYVDPPYPFSVRTAARWPSELKRAYHHNLDDDGHRALAAALHRVKGMVVLSGYPCALYDQELYPSWRRLTVQTMADGAAPRVEALYLNAAAERAHGAGDLFRSMDA